MINLKSILLIKGALCCWLIVSIPGLTIGQTPAGANIRLYKAALGSLKERRPIEKLYVQTDKPYYTTGDTLWFKAYLLNGDFLTLSEHSKILYIELDGLDNTMIKRIMVPVNLGLAWAEIALDEKQIPPGTYILRAYTNWMRNFGEDYIFKKVIPISAVNNNTTLVSTGFKLQNKAGQSNVEAAIQFRNLAGTLLPLQPMQLKLMNGRHNLMKDKITTGLDGVVKVNFDIPVNQDINQLSLKIQPTGNTSELTIPVLLNRPENIDLQFMPEGGNLVAGINSTVGFKAMGEDGKGFNLSGEIVDSKQQPIISFASTYAGMGSFEFKPLPSEKYTAKVNLPNGEVKTYPLPAVNAAGTVLHVDETSNDTSKLTLRISSGAIDKTEVYYLVGQARGVLCYAEPVDFKSESQVSKIVAKSLFPTGITRFTLINSHYQPLNERQVFIDHHDNLQVSVVSNKKSYGIRDNIGLSIQVKDKDGLPVRGIFSVAVTDAGQVKNDSLASNIATTLLLTSDLKGEIESPGYYFTGNKTTELDNLMLTQGWVGYDWKDVFYPKTGQPEFVPEKEFLVKGTVTNAFGKPIENSKVVLLANHPLVIKDTVTNKDGQFAFRGIFPVDTALFKLQARNKRGNANNVQIIAEEVKPPVFTTFTNVVPWYVNSDTSLLNNAKTHIAELTAKDSFNGNGHLLKEVNIKDKKIIQGSKNLNGPGEADQILDEKDMEKAGKMSLHDLLQQKVKGFNISAYPSTHPKRLSYKINMDELHFVIDGIDLDFFFDFSSEGPPLDLKRYVYIKGVLDYITAEDVIGIEVMYNDRYAANYGIEYNLKGPYIEITTRSKHGPFMKAIPGTYLYKTLAFTVPKQFYRPKYTATNNSKGLGTDLRSTIHWAPNVLTDKEGKAAVSFYSADKPSKYNVIVEGIDMVGNVGYKQESLKVTTARTP